MAKKPTHVESLFDKVNGGDDVDAAAEAQEILLDMMECSQNVIDNWEKGDLAAAVTALGKTLQRAKTG